VSRPDAAAPLHILLLCDFRDDIAATVRDHIEALERYSRHRFWRISMLGDISPGLDLSRFDAIIVHYTLVACHDSYLSPASRERIGAFKGLKAIFIQDEYRFVDASIAAMRQLGIHVLFTCVPEPEIPKVYPDAKLPNVLKVNVLTGYVPGGLTERQVPDPATRRIDVGYRGRDVPAWLGELGQEKVRIGKRFAADAGRYGLVCDISYREEDRFYGDAWIDYLCRCKAVLGVESGATVFDFSGEIQKRVELHVAREPHASFETLSELYFKNEEGRISLAQISPRCFESAAVRTLMILYEGEYSGLLVPWRHYVPLKKDHSNMDEVVAVLRDPARLGAITEAAFREVACAEQNSFPAFVRKVDEMLESALRPEMLATGPRLTREDFSRAVGYDFKTVRRRIYRATVSSVYNLIFRRILGWATPAQRDRIHRRLRQVYNVLTFYEYRAQRRENGRKSAENRARS
jgi:hypothetical protein